MDYSTKRYNPWLIIPHKYAIVKTKTKTFPIAFSNSCYSVLNIMNVNSNRYENPYVIDVTASSFKSGLSGVNYAMYWIAVGKQQWGKTSSSGRATTTVTLPISMSNQIYNVVISQAAASDTWSTWSSIVSASQIKLTNNYGPGSWWYATGC